MPFKVESIGFENLQKYLKNLQIYAKNPARTFAESKLIMIKDILDHFKKEEGPYGKWKPLSPLTLEIRKRKTRKGTSTKILQDTGRYRASITGISSGKGVEVGTNISYARKHEYGEGTPKRIVFWLSKNAGERIVDRFIKDMQGL